ncbi:MAG TPA: tetraacyldisaccharide 4'-kinase [Myxococcota bacterium]|jgi:tetraacyldisaccharide 4'-kinase
MRMAWLESREAGLAASLALLPLALVSGCWEAGARLHRALYRSGALAATRLPCRVVSIGNLSVGGTGKTPTAAWLAERLHRRGHRVALASRGYRRVGRETVVTVSDGRRVLATAEQAGDEPFVLAAHAPGVPVLVGSDRALVGQRAISAHGAEILVLDDGFQHHRLERDLDVVVCDGALGFGNRWVLPRGPLREPLAVLRRAEAVGVVDGPLDERDEAALARFAPGARRFAARRRPVGLRPLEGGRLEPPESLAGARVGLLAAIARPASLRRSLEALGAEVVAERTFRDHHRYRPRDLAGLADQAALWVTTEKDAIKLLPSWVGSARVVVLVIELEVEAPEALLDWIEARLRASI